MIRIVTSAILLIAVFFYCGQTFASENTRIGTYVYGITSEDIKAFKTTKNVFKIIDDFRNFHFPDTTHFLEELEKGLKDYPESVPYIRSAVRDGLEMPSKLLDEYCAEETGLVCQVFKLTFTDKTANELKKRLRATGRFAELQEPALKFMENFIGVTFPDSSLFHRYAISSFQASMGVCNKEVRDAYTYVNSFMWTQDEVNLFGQYIESFNRKKDESKKISRLFEAMKLQRMKKFVCTDPEWEESYAIADSLYSLTLRRLFVPILRKYYTFNDSLPPSWQAENCGCVRKDILYGEVYGIYPYWQASLDDGTMDFNAVNRIGYYGINVDNTGKLTLPASKKSPIGFFSAKKNNRFVERAHDHDVRVDFIIEKNDWPRDWTKQDVKMRSKFFETLVDEIESLVTAFLPASFKDFTALFTCTGTEMRTVGDGVTLYFRNYPEDSLSTAEFNRFYSKLLRRLQKHGNHYFVNFMASHPDVRRNGGIYSIVNFRHLLDNFKKATKFSSEEFKREKRSLFLVLMDEPFSRTRRQLHNELDSRLRGSDHKMVVQSMAPVVWFDNRQWEQLRDDIDYYSYNYDIIGMSLNSASAKADSVCGPGGSVTQCILREFTKEGTEIEDVSFLNRFVCTHRWLFRFVHIVVCLVSGLCFVVCFAVCRVRAKIGRYLSFVLAGFLVPPLVLTALLVFFDPAMNYALHGFSMQMYVFMVFVAVLLIAGISYSQSGEKPTRK